MSEPNQSVFKIKIMKKILIILFLTSFSLIIQQKSPVFGDAKNSKSPISTTSNIDKKEVTVGDKFTYSISIQHDPEIKIAPPNPSMVFSDFEFVDQGSLPSQKKEGQIIENFWFQLRADKVGNFTFPKIQVNFTIPNPKNPNTLIPGQIFAPKNSIVVRSVLYEDGEPTDIKDIKPIIGARPAWEKWLLVIGSILAGLAILIVFFKWASQPKHENNAPLDNQTPSAQELIKIELQGLLQKNLIQQGFFQDHYFELSEIFRRYLGAIFNIPALDWTTEEIKFYFEKKNIPFEIQENAIQLLQKTDQVKFAKAPINTQTSLDDIESINDFVLMTTHQNQHKQETALTNK